MCSSEFQPTPPTRTETSDRVAQILESMISTHSAHEDGDHLQKAGPILLSISTHSAHEDGDSYLEFLEDYLNISTHSAHEDGDGNTTQKNQQFFITFPQSNHIILPQITANLPCTHPKPFSLCSFSGANPPVNSCLLLVRTKLFETSLPPAAWSEYQRLFHFNPFTHPNMFNLCSVFISQVVKSKAVRLLINDICQYGF